MDEFRGHFGVNFCPTLESFLNISSTEHFTVVMTKKDKKCGFGFLLFRQLPENPFQGRLHREIFRVFN
jgi:hypothetical protein